MNEAALPWIGKEEQGKVYAQRKEKGEIMKNQFKNKKIKRDAQTHIAGITVIFLA